MSPADCLIQNLEQGPLTYTELRYNQLGLDVRRAADTCLKDKLITQVWERVSDENDPPQEVNQVTWAITNTGIARMELLRNPPEPEDEVVVVDAPAKDEGG